MENQVLKFVNKSNNPDPVYAKEGDSGFDLRAWLENPITLKPLERELVPTGIFLDIPFDCEVQIRPRSGCAAKQGLTVANTPGTADQPYTGEIKIIAINLSNEDIVINNGDRIAQAVLMPVYSSNRVTLTKVDNITKVTSRNADGFGSTGIK